MSEETKKEPTKVEKFFRELSRRMYKENDLSDMVYALCRSNPGFMQFFLNFIFGVGKLVASDFRIEREVSFDNKDRPDFVLTNKHNGERYFIEVKIGDRNHHFSQYCSRLDELNKSVRCSGPHLGYITNYEINEDELPNEDKSAFNNCKEYYHTWSEFKDVLSMTGQIGVRDEDVKGLLAYCEMVCPTPFEDESVDNYEHDPRKFNAIKGWYEALERCLNEINTISITIGDLLHAITIKKYRVANTPAESVGIYFEAQDVTENIDDKEKMCNGQKIWGWAGWRLTRNFYPGFCIAFDNINGWGAPVFKYLAKEDEWWLPFCFDYPDKTIPQQDLNQYLENIIRAVFGAIINKDIDIGQTSQKRELPEVAYAPRALSLWLRQQVFPKLNCEGYQIVPFQKKDSFNPKSCCGEYFEVKTNPSGEENGKSVGVYWVGTYFDSTVRKGKDGKNINNGSLVCEKIGCYIEQLSKCPELDLVSKLNAILAQDFPAKKGSPSAVQ